MRTSQSAWSWPPDAEVKFRRKYWAKRRGLSKPGPRGDRAIRRKPSRRECRLFGVPVMTCVRFSTLLHARARVRVGTRHSLRSLIDEGGMQDAELGQTMPRGYPLSSRTSEA